MGFADLDFKSEFHDVEPFGSGGGFIAIPTMPVKGKIVDMEVTESKDGTGQSVKFFFEITEPKQYAGASRNLKMRVIDDTEKGQNSRPAWRCVLESIGVAAAKLDVKGKVRVQGTLFDGRIAHLMNMAGVEGATDNTKFDAVEFITPSAYKERLAAYEHSNRPSRGAAGGRAAAPAEDLNDLGDDSTNLDDENGNGAATPVRRGRPVGSTNRKPAQSAASSLLD